MVMMRLLNNFASQPVSPGIQWIGVFIIHAGSFRRELRLRAPVLSSQKLPIIRCKADNKFRLPLFACLKQAVKKLLLIGRGPSE